MSETESDASEGVRKRKRGAKAESEALPPAGAESEPSPPEAGAVTAEPEPAAADAVTVDAVAATPAFEPVTVDVAAASAETEAAPVPPAMEQADAPTPIKHPESHDEAMEDEATRSFAAWVLGFLLLLFAGAALGIW